MIDVLLNLVDNPSMLTAIKNPTKKAAPASQPATVSAADLEFLSVNQQLEGFPGKITEEIAAHRPNMAEIAASARRFGAQIPTEENRQKPPLFPLRGK